MLHTRLSNFPVFRNYRDFALRWYGHSGNKSSNLNVLKFDVKFCEIEAEVSQATFHILLGILKRFKFLISCQAPGTLKAVLTNHIRAQTTVL